MALNIAADRRQADARLLTGEEVEELLQVGDEALDPARVVGGQKIQSLLSALYELRAASQNLHRRAAGRGAAPGNLPAFRHFHAHGREGNQSRIGLLRRETGKKSVSAVRSRGRKTVF
jgi:hypothetical protein